MACSWTMAAIALHPDVRARVAGFAPERGADPTLDTIRRIVYGDRPSREAMAELAPTGTLRRFALIERSDGGGPDVHESRQTWAISRRVLAFLHGDDRVDPELARLVAIRAPLPLEAVAIADAAKAEIAAALRVPGAVVLVSGSPGAGRRTVLTATHPATLEVDARTLSREPAQLSRQLRAIAREHRLLGRSPLVANVDSLGELAALIPTELAPLVDGPLLLTCGARRPPLRFDRDRTLVHVELPPATSAQRATLWHAALAQGTSDDAELLAGQYPLAPAMIHAAAHVARTRAVDRALVPDDIYAGIRTVLDDKLGDHARRVTVTQTWDDLVLPQDHVDAVVELMARVRERRRVYESWGFGAKVGKGLGVAALFSGPPGTGKTMVAALIARDLGLELYQVDMARLTSKYIGETEKHLSELFDAAEAGHAVLLFDEADSLFGKRTEVRSSNDRYANLETNYLLQRLESFTGTCILTSNHEGNIDPAFLRRLALHVRFDVPDEAERAALWRAMLPAAAPVAPDLDLADLARRYAMSGGYIRNAAVRAAFLAADQGAVISAAHLDRAARLEYEAMGKLAA